MVFPEEDSLYPEGSVVNGAAILRMAADDQGLLSFR
jgi:hypothetical protein